MSYDEMKFKKKNAPIEKQKPESVQQTLCRGTFMHFLNICVNKQTNKQGCWFFHCVARSNGKSEF